jgi:hypothetical protein
MTNGDDKPKLWPMEGGGAVVKVDDVEQAKTAYRDWLLVEEEWAPADIDKHLSKVTVRAGWYRWTPCSERSCFDHGNHRPGHIKYEEAPGRGVWRGVLLLGYP